MIMTDNKFNGTQEKNYAVTTAFALHLEQVAKVSDLSERLGLKRSAIVRMAIDLLYEKYQQEPAE